MAVSSKSMVGYRTEALAKVGLTRRDDLRIAEYDIGGLDMLVQILLKDERFYIFGVDVKGTEKHLPTIEAASDFAKGAFLVEGKHKNTLSASRHQYFFPVIGLLYSVQMDSGYWAWLTEPITLNGACTLRNNTKIICQPFDRPALDLIVDKTMEWYQFIESSFVTVAESA